MRILVLSDLYPPYYLGGHEIQCKVITDELCKKGHQVFVLTSRYGINSRSVDGNIFRLLHYSLVGNVRGLKRRHLQIKHVLLTRLNYFIAENTIRKLHPHIIYAFQTTGISIYPLKAIKSFNIPVVHHSGNYYFVQLVKDCILEKNLIKKLFRKIIYGFCSFNEISFEHMITVSEAVKQKHVQVGFNKNHISVISLACVPSTMVSKKSRHFLKDSDKVRLLYVGQLTREKGVHVAMESIDYLVNVLRIENVILDVFGDGPDEYKNELKSIIHSRGIDNYVTFRGKKTREMILHIYNDYDILLFPSIWEEPFAGILVESLSQGLPVVASNTGGTSEIIFDGFNGILVPPGDSIKMAEAVKNILESQSLYEYMSNHGISEVETKYTNEVIIEKIQQYLNRVIGHAADQDMNAI